MNEQQWLKCTDPEPMLQFLRGKVSARKLRLFACACCRRLRALLKDKNLCILIETIELYADGLARAKDLLTPNQAYQKGKVRLCGAGAIVIAARTGLDFYRGISKEEAAFNVARETSEMSLNALITQKKADRAMKVQSHILRDIIGNPFLHRVDIDSAWLTPTVKALAQVFYNDRRFIDLPILADALEEVGCTNQQILNHCRQPGVHVRGCWVVDSVLAKE
jgi:hypothetical protein